MITASNYSLAEARDAVKWYFETYGIDHSILLGFFVPGEFLDDFVDKLYAGHLGMAFAKFDNVIIAVDDQHFTLSSWLETNCLAADVDHISDEDAQAVMNLKVGESTPVHFSHVKRIK